MQQLHFLFCVFIATSSLSWKESSINSSLLPYPIGAFVGYIDRKIWLLGNNAQGSKDLIQYDIKNQTLTNHPNNSFSFSYEYAQSSTQIHDILYMMPYSGTAINVFNLTSSTIVDTIIGYDQYLRLKGMACLVQYKEEYIMVLGGGWASVNYFVIYDITNRQWTYSTPIPLTVSGASCNIVDNILYLIGGRGCAGDYCDSVRTINISTAPIVDSDWYTFAETLSEKRTAHRSVVIDHMIYVVGGHTFYDAPLNTVDIIDTFLKRIHLDSRLVVAKSQMSLILVNNVLYAFGGSPYIYGSYFQYAIISATKNATMLNSTATPQISTTNVPTTPTTSTIDVSTMNPTTHSPQTNVPNVPNPTINQQEVLDSHSTTNVFESKRDGHIYIVLDGIAYIIIGAIILCCCMSLLIAIGICYCFWKHRSVEVINTDTSKINSDTSKANKSTSLEIPKLPIRTIADRSKTSPKKLIDHDSLKYTPEGMIKMVNKSFEGNAKLNLFATESNMIEMQPLPNSPASSGTQNTYSTGTSMNNIIGAAHLDKIIDSGSSPKIRKVDLALTESEMSDGMYQTPKNTAGIQMFYAPSQQRSGE